MKEIIREVWKKNKFYCLLVIFSFLFIILGFLLLILSNSIS